MNYLRFGLVQPVEFKTSKPIPSQEQLTLASLQALKMEEEGNIAMAQPVGILQAVIDTFERTGSLKEARRVAKGANDPNSPLKFFIVANDRGAGNKDLRDYAEARSSNIGNGADAYVRFIRPRMFERKTNPIIVTDEDVQRLIPPTQLIWNTNGPSPQDWIH
jgi:hypothetical protein